MKLICRINFHFQCIYNLLLPPGTLPKALATAGVSSSVFLNPLLALSLSLPHLLFYPIPPYDWWSHFHTRLHSLTPTCLNLMLHFLHVSKLPYFTNAVLHTGDGPDEDGRK